ncbi:AAA family ATPase [Aeromonas veronii]|uniref:AAA family ATPase n=1 Tax=Aeromonas veronii TaxID=654 RepID=UPI00111AC356|nr:AAA family ATPase [Aeromonas veronii]TNJ13382.1 hypothetical protein CF107_00930 [Aeromonas veronii]
MSKIYDQKIISIEVKKLKGIENMEPLLFLPKNVTAILGANCVGKSSLLHAIASSYQPEHGEKSENHRMSEYLKPNPHALWNNTEFSVKLQYKDRANGDNIISDTRTYTKRSERWKPRYDRRPYRSVFYIGIHTTLPALEYINFIKNKSKVGSQRIRYETTELKDELYQKVKDKVSYIFNRQYSSIYKHKIATWPDELYGLSYGDMTYSQISMGAGEQRVIKILKTVFDAPKNSIILIDEIDLLLHEDAFQKIIEVINLHACDKHQQVIFTTHRESVLRKSNDINIRYLHKVGTDTKVLDQVTPDLLAKLTGTLEKSITLFVEDKLSSRIVKKISQELEISRHIKSIEYGVAHNCFAVTAGAYISDSSKKTLGIIDGDKFRSQEEKNKIMCSVITGTSAESRIIRESVLNRIYQYTIPIDKSPEQYIKECICRLVRDNVPESYREIYDALSNIEAVLNRHNYVNSITDFYDESEEVIIKDVVELFSKTSEWYEFTSEVTNSIKHLAEELTLLPHHPS